MRDERIPGARDVREDEDELQFAVLCELAILHPAGLAGGDLQRKFAEPHHAEAAVREAVRELYDCGLVHRGLAVGEEVITLTRAAARLVELRGGTV